MSNLFSCFACTKKQKKLKDGSGAQDKRPKERKSKQKKNKHNKENPVSNDTVDYFLNPVPSEQLKSEPQNSAADKKIEPVEVHLECKVEPEPTKKDSPLLDTRNDHPNNYMEDNKNGDGDHASDITKQIPQIKIDDESERFSTKNPTKVTGSQSDANESSDESCLTDSDLNISEIVFVSEQGPRVGSGYLNTSRGGIHTMKATVENEQFLEKELLRNIGKNKNANTTSLSFSLENRCRIASVEEKQF